MLYTVQSKISVRLSAKPGTKDFERFRDWEPGDLLDSSKAPDYLDIKRLIQVGALVPLKEEEKEAAE